MKTTEKPVSIQEEVEAALLEGMKPLPENFVALREEYNDINEMIAELNARKEAIKMVVGLQADMDAVSAYTVNGVKVMGFNHSTVTNVDRDKLKSHYPDVYEDVVSTSDRSSFFCKK